MEPKKQTVKKVIDLSGAVLIGEGDHKRTFIDPADPGRCVKILFTTPDVDMERELAYRRSRERRGLTGKLLPAYYGTVETSLGTGYVFERVLDFDGRTSRTFRDLFEEAGRDGSLLPCIEKVMERCKEQLFAELIVTSNVEPTNFMVQRLSETEFTIRIIDNLGTPVWLPLAYYFDALARKRLRKYWNRFLNELQRKYPAVMTDKLKQKLSM